MKENSIDFWVIEGRDCYWDGHGLEQSHFGDIHHAVQFATEASAACVRDCLLTKFAVGLRVTSHRWINMPEKQ